MKYTKKELLHIVGELENINLMIKNASPHPLTAMGAMLEDCQQKAITIGTYLEAQGEKGKPIVKLLEDYCEKIYQLNSNLTNADECRKISKKIVRLLNEVKNAIQYDFEREKKEVVFLPYKAAMWDSLESIWRAAEKDESCDVYVVPIPYFDKGPDGSLAHVHYEGTLYPEDVPVTHWEKYSLEEHKPDVIFIHNPYDQCNYVTTVHPDYYAERLRNYTDLLVYVPYFVGINDRVQGHFCTMPGVLYADRVIVESENVKKIYINSIQRFEKENDCKGRFGKLEQKILALGSPKIDRVKKIKREDIAIPEQWEKLIRKEGGARKKVVLYNTTIDALLKNSEAVMEKIRDTMQIFKEHPKAILLWRPHPLLLSTLYAMRPELYQEFCQMVQEYKEEAWGIYDDTADIERAIALSDAYYGDWSSVVTLYQATGKPMMIQNFEVNLVNAHRKAAGDITAVRPQESGII